MLEVAGGLLLLIGLFTRRVTAFILCGENGGGLFSERIIRAVLFSHK